MKQETKRTFWALIIIFLIAANVFTIWFVYHKYNQLVEDLTTNKYHRHRPRYPNLKQKIVNNLSLSPTQIKHLNVITKNFRDSMHIYHDSLAYYRHLFDSQMQSSNPDYDLMNLAAHKIGYFVSKMRLNMLVYYKNIRDMLSDRQRQRLSRLFKNIHPKKYKP